MSKSSSSNSTAKSWAATKLARRLLKHLLQVKSPLNKRDQNKFLQVYQAGMENREVFEQLRQQSDQFDLIYPLFAHADGDHKKRLLCVLHCCVESVVSAKLLAKEKRVWTFLAAMFEDDLRTRTENFGNIGAAARSEKCSSIWSSCCHTTQEMIPHIDQQISEFAVRETDILEHLLTGIQNPRLCSSRQSLFLIFIILKNPIISKYSIDTLACGGLFTLMETLMQKSGNLLKEMLACPDCNFTIGPSFNPKLLMSVKKI